MMNILVTGAAGYVGSVVTERLLSEGHRVIALDNLGQGHREALASEAHFVRADLCDFAALDDIFSQHNIDAVMHLAALSIIPHSVEDPRTYFQTNIVGGLNLLNSILTHDVKGLVFSSSAGIYGRPENVPVTEDTPQTPIHPYGECKVMFERILKWYGEAYGLNSISLRYFNAAGATELHGEHHQPETHLIPNVFRVPLGKAEHVTIFGNDYETEDGTCVRDYVHVVDIADAHLQALVNINGARAKAYNLGSGTGYSNLQVVKMVEEVTGDSIPIIFESRRAGDPPVLVASARLARQELGWTPRLSGLEDIVKSAWQWQSRFPDGYSG
ncbi:MAG: UDP-glucose 4-epimerase GalE [Dehalococcoidales bacterium]|nr:MAG: UDP-glucose 4-epimerase GalE [Dehalococcoidales bacterium]